MAQNISEKIEVTAAQLPKLITRVTRAGLVPYVSASPGIGKSQIAHQIADTHNLQVIDMRLAGCDPTDLNGFPALKGERAKYLPFSDFPIEGDSLPDGKSGWLLLLDELSSAPRGVQAAAYKLILDRMTGSNKLHEKVDDGMW